MPEIDENILKNKLKEVRRRSVMAAAAWLEMFLCADKGDVEGCREMYGRVRTLTVETSDFLKSIEADRKE